MKNELEYELINVQKTLAKMKSWAKEKDRRFRQQKRVRDWAFGDLVKKLKIK